MKLPRLKTEFWLILLIIIAGGVLRFWGLLSNPPALNWDEVSHGYNAYSILKTGKDEWGTAFPLIFRAFGDYKLPVYIYLTTIAEAIFGLNTFSVRIVSVIAGILAILGVYLLTNELFQKKTLNLFGKTFSLGLLSAFFLAFLPWHFFISRPALEANLALTIIIFGFYFLLRAFRNGNYLPAVILLGLSLHTYNTARVFVPLLLVASFLIYRPKLKLNLSNVISAILLASSALVILFQVTGGSGTARYDKLKILSDTAVYGIGEKRLTSTLPDPLPRLLFNRPVFFLTEVGKNYFSYFSPQFFYQSAGAQTQFALPNHNLVTLPLFVLSLVGVLYLIKNTQNRSHLFILAWLIISPLAASLTSSPPQALRPTPMIPALVIISVLGIIAIESRFSKHSWVKTVLLPMSTLFFLVSFVSYLRDYYLLYPQKYSQSWQYGYEQAIGYLQQNRNQYANVVMTKRYGEPHIFYAFFTKMNPQLMWQGSDNIRFNQSDWYWTDKLDGVYFANDWDIPGNQLVSFLKLENGGKVPAVNTLLFTSPDHIPTNFRILKTINFLDESPAFVIAKSI